MQRDQQHYYYMRTQHLQGISTFIASTPWYLSWVLAFFDSLLDHASHAAYSHSYSIEGSSYIVMHIQLPNIWDSFFIWRPGKKASDGIGISYNCWFCRILVEVFNSTWYVSNQTL